MSHTTDILLQRHTRTVWLLETSPETAESVAPGTEGALEFVLARVSADRIRANLLYAVLGRDGYMQYAAWYGAQAQKALAAAKAGENKPGEEPFDDALPEDTRWRAHTLALETSAEAAVLEEGMADPPYATVGHALGPYRQALVRELVQWGRTPPAWNEQEEGSGNSSRASSAPP